MEGNSENTKQGQKLIEPCESCKDQELVTETSSASASSSVNTNECNRNRSDAVLKISPGLSNIVNIINIMRAEVQGAVNKTITAGLESSINETIKGVQKENSEYIHINESDNNTEANIQMASDDAQIQDDTSETNEAEGSSEHVYEVNPLPACIEEGSIIS